MAEYKFSSPFNQWDLSLWQAIRVWPEDQNLQINHLRHLFRVSEAGYEKDFPEEAALPEVMAYLKTVLAPLGGRGALCNMKSEIEMGKDLDKRTAQGEITGIILTIAHQLVTVAQRPELASWSRIVHLVERECQSGHFNINFSKTSMVESWKTYETVAHLWAAHLFLGGFWHKNASWPDCGAQREMELSLAYAKTFQDFGLSFKVKRSKKAFLNPEILHTFDVPYHGVCVLGPFPAAWIQILEGYMAPRDLND